MRKTHWASGYFITLTSILSTLRLIYVYKFALIVTSTGNYQGERLKSVIDYMIPLYFFKFIINNDEFD